MCFIFDITGMHAVLLAVAALLHVVVGDADLTLRSSKAVGRWLETNTARVREELQTHRFGFIVGMPRSGV